ncbi:MAG: hypothetical protein H0V17_34220 [Deltaproteobacteria bacterium]|nr:hypothetical protein [Deltaproteobacteria bacterium]
MRFVIVILLLVYATPAHADEPPTRVESYGNTILVLDAIALGVAVPGVIGLYLTERGSAGRVLSIIATSVGGALYVYGAPLVHNAKQRTKDRSYLSIGMRVLGTGLVAAVGASIGELKCPAEDKNCRDIATGFVIAAGIGAVAVSAIDIKWVAKRRVVVAPSPGGAVVGLDGDF